MEKSIKACVLACLLGASLGLVATRADAAPDTARERLCDSVKHDNLKIEPDSPLRPGPTSRWISLVECWDADESNGQYRFLNGLYTHLTVSAVDVPLTGKGRASRDYKKRSWWKAWSEDDQSTNVAILKTTINDPQMAITTPLLALTYDAKASAGAAWVSQAAMSDARAPYFRITPNTNIRFSLELQTSRNVSSHASAGVIDIVQKVLAVASPSTTLLTASNKDQINQLSSATDTLISAINTESASETLPAGRSLSEWYGTGFILAAITIPDNVDMVYIQRNEGAPPTTAPVYVDDENRLIVLKIGLSCPRLSIFDTLNSCRDDQADDYTRPPEKADLTKWLAEWGEDGEKFKKLNASLSKRINAPQVLGFKMASEKTVKQYLTDQPWYATQLQSLTLEDRDARKAAKADKAAADETIGAEVGGFCRQVVTSLYDAGLSRFDARLGLWALVAGAPEFASLNSRFIASDDCTKLLPLDFKFGTVKIVALPGDKAAKPTSGA